MRSITKSALGILMICGTWASPALADYPEEAITIIVPFSAGGGTDLTARTVAMFLEAELGESVVVVNRPGAGGEIALTEVASAKPDGYTLGIINTPGIVTIPIERNAAFDITSFDFVAGMVEDPATINTLESSGISTLEELVEAAKERPGEITVGTQGVGSAGHISLLLLERAADVTFRAIPFSGAAPARTALLSGEIIVTTANLGEALNFAEGNPWNILAVMSTERSSVDGSIPTFAEAGYDIVGGSIRGFGGPAGMPQEVLDRLQIAFENVANDPEFKRISANTNQPLRYIPRDEYAATLERSDEIHRELWEAQPWRE
jgi:tripartite-type tricarboxylate transporter receptor subunit TctC